MNLRNAFTVAASRDRTWETLLDLQRVAGCLPGAQIEPVGEDGLYRGHIRIKVGPVAMAYSGTVRIAEVDTDAYTASFEARANETKGTGTAAALIRNTLEEVPEGTRVTVETDLNVTGRPAQFGRGIMENVASTMLAQFAKGLEELIVSGPQAPATVAAGGRQPAQSTASASTPVDREPAPASAATLDVGALLVKNVARPGVVAGLAGAALAALLVLRRRSRAVELKFRYRL